MSTSPGQALFRRIAETMAHEPRTDFAMLLGALFLLVVGAGASSLDARLTSSKARHE